METELIQKAITKKSLKFEEIGKKCLELYPSANVWQAVEKCRLIKHQFLMDEMQELEPETRRRKVADYLEICEVADYFANQLATKEQNETPEYGYCRMGRFASMKRGSI